MEQVEAGFGVLPASSTAERTHNPIRVIVETLKIPETTSEDKKLIPLSIGDPTRFGNLRAPGVLVRALQAAAADFSTHGYAHSAGTPAARAAVAARQGRACGRDIMADDVVLASGCSGALEIAIKALASEGDNILLPQPGFALYETLAKSNGIEVRYYPLLPECAWEADVAALERLVDARTRALLVNNPSNPCGSVYRKEHLEELLAVAERRGVPVIADEIYGNIVFEGSKFHPLASLTRSVPILEVGGIAKEFLVPGLRVGWIVIHDAPATRASEPGASALKEVRTALMRMTQLIIGCNTLTQAALPAILDPQPGSPDAAELEAFHAATLRELEANAAFVAERLRAVPGLRVVEPQGAMYVMVGLDRTRVSDAEKWTDQTFARALLEEELVFVLPGTCFGIPDFVRVVFCAPREVLADACDRIAAFCSRHF